MTSGATVEVVGQPPFVHSDQVSSVANPPGDPVVRAVPDGGLSTDGVGSGKLGCRPRPVCYLNLGAKMWDVLTRRVETRLILGAGQHPWPPH